MADKIPYTDIAERMKSDIDYVAEEAYRAGFRDGYRDGKKIAQENIFKTMEKFSDGDVDYDKLTVGDFRVIMEIGKRMQKRKEGE